MDVSSLRDAIGSDANCELCQRASEDRESECPVHTRPIELDAELMIEFISQITDPEQLNPILEDLPSLLEDELFHSQNVQELDREVRVRRKALDLFPSHHNSRAAMAYGLARALYYRFNAEESPGDLEDINETLRFCHVAVSLAKPGNQDLPKYLETLGLSFSARFERNRDPKDLEEAISHLKRGMELLPSDSPERLRVHLSLLGILRSSPQDLGVQADHDSAVDLELKLLTMIPKDHLAYCVLVCDISRHFLYRSKQGDCRWRAEKAMGYLEEIVDIVQPGHPGRITFLMTLAHTLYKRYKASGLIEDLDRSLSHSRDAMGLSSQSDPAYFAALKDALLALAHRYKLSGAIADLDDLIKYLRTRLDICTTSGRDAERLSTLSELSFFLRARFGKQGYIGDINDAITYSREVVELTQSEGLDKLVSALREHSSAFKERFSHTGDVTDIDNAVLHLRQAITLVPAGHPARHSTLKSLADHLLSRYLALFDDNDSREATGYLYEVLDTTSPTDEDYPQSLKAFVDALLSRRSRGGLEQDLEFAEKCHNKALALCPDSHPRRSEILLSLEHVLWARKGNKRDKNSLKNLSNMISIYREVDEKPNNNHYEITVNQSNLASALGARFESSGDLSDFEDAISAFLQAQAGLPADHPYQAEFAASLGNTYMKAFEVTKRPEDCDKAFRSFEEGANCFAAGPMACFVIAQVWATRARLLSHPSALKAYTIAMSLLDRHVMVSQNIETKHRALADAGPWFILNATSCAITEGKLETAIELMEQGRAVLWSEVERYRAPLDRLEVISPKLAAEFRDLSHALEKNMVSLESTLPTDASGYRLLSSRWNALLDRIREVDGLSSFLKPTTFAALQKAAMNGPLVVVNIDDFRSDAIIVQYTSSPILIPLPNTTPDVVAALSSTLKAALHSTCDDAAKTKNAKIIKVLRDLWGLIVCPVVKELQDNCGILDGARIWWCPTSTLWSLPLHAAGPYRRGQRNMPDIFISSYTPTLSALIRANSLREKGSVSLPPTMLVVGQAETPGQVPLFKVAEEITQVQASATASNVLEGEAATRNMVICGLQQSSWVHLACHGHQNLMQPFKSHFSLYDGPLTLVDIVQNCLSSAEFAFLSACDSAATDQTTPNEAIHLAAALQFSGFASVVGTMWAMADIDGPIIAREFYSYIFRNGQMTVAYEESAQALNIATRALRRQGVPIGRWINFVHIGA